MDTRHPVRGVLHSLGAHDLAFDDCLQRAAKVRQALCISKETVMLAIDRQSLLIGEDESGEERQFLARDEMRLVGTRTIVEYQPRSPDSPPVANGAPCLPPADLPPLDVDSRIV